MGPTIILDKSAYQCLSRDDTFELRRYFHVVVPPVLVLEILADLKDPDLDHDDTRALVRQLATKISPMNTTITLDYRTLCVGNLLGGQVEMGRRPVLAGGRWIKAQDGRDALFFDAQPEQEALSRWSEGHFEEAEELLATQWRDASKAIDLESFRTYSRSNYEWEALESLSLVRQLVDAGMDLPDAYDTLIGALTQELRTIPEVNEWARDRWRNGNFTAFRAFAPYAHHCLRVDMMFHLALVHGLISTRSTNRIDVEYLYYSPFAYIFCSGDKFHRTLAEQVLDSDQSFVWHDDLRSALRQVAEARKQAKESGIRDFRGLEPCPDSLRGIRSLWIN